MKGKMLRELIVKKKKKSETPRVMTQRPLMETAKVETLAHRKQKARERTQEPSKNQ